MDFPAAPLTLQLDPSCSSAAQAYPPPFAASVSAEDYNGKNHSRTQAI